jgi:Flp pilus assembly protein TadG
MTTTTTPRRDHQSKRRAAGEVRSCRAERGAVTAQIVIATPVLLLMILLIVQFAVWSQATHVAQAAAAQGLAAARAAGGSSSNGQAEAQQVLAELDTGPLTGSRIQSTRSADSASVTITGTAEVVVPFLHLRVHAETVGDVERFTTP